MLNLHFRHLNFLIHLHIWSSNSPNSFFTFPLNFLHHTLSSLIPHLLFKILSIHFYFIFYSIYSAYLPYLFFILNPFLILHFPLPKNPFPLTPFQKILKIKFPKILKIKNPKIKKKTLLQDLLKLKLNYLLKTN